MQPVYDLWSAFFLLSAAAGIISSLFIFFHFWHQKSAIWISSLTLLFSVAIADWLIYWTNNQQKFPHLFLLTFFFNFFYGPFFYFYIKELAGDRLTKFQRFVHFVPFLSAIMVCTPILLSSAQQKEEIILHGYQNKLSFYRYFIPLASWVSVTLMLLYGFLSLKMAARFSLYKTVQKWAITTILSFCIFCLNFLVYEILSKMSFFNPLWDYGIAVSMILMMFVLIVSAYVQPQIFNGFSFLQSLPGMAKDSDIPDINDTVMTDAITEQVQEFSNANQATENPKVHASPDDVTYYPENVALSNVKINTHTTPRISTQESVHLIERLNELMINEKIFTQYDLRLDTIAERLYVSRKKISHLINEKYEMNFFDYINTMRIEEAKHLLETEFQLSVKEIMYSVGFNNKVSFYKAFKNKTGLTPTDYKEKVHGRA